jgi:hypothetical protein
MNILVYSRASGQAHVLNYIIILAINLSSCHLSLFSAYSTSLLVTEGKIASVRGLRLFFPNAFLAVNSAQAVALVGTCSSVIVRNNCSAIAGTHGVLDFRAWIDSTIFRVQLQY